MAELGICALFARWSRRTAPESDLWPPAWTADRRIATSRLCAAPTSGRVEQGPTAGDIHSWLPDEVARQEWHRAGGTGDRVLARPVRTPARHALAPDAISGHPAMKVASGPRDSSNRSGRAAPVPG